MRFRNASILALAILMSASWAGAAPVIKLTYANFPPATTFPCVQMERWAQEVEKRTNGAVTVQTFPGGTLLGAKNMIDGVISGVADIGCFSPSYQPGRFPVSEAIDLPFGFANAKVASLVYEDLVQKYAPKELEKVKVITLFTCSPANLMSKSPVRTLADFKGLELRVAGTGVDVVKALGGVPVAMPQSETPDAIQKGVVKGMVSSMEVLKDMNFADSCRYATTLNTHVVSFGVVMNQARWKSLPADVQKVITDLEREQDLWTATYADDHVTEALAWAAKTYGHTVLTLPADEQARVKKLMTPLIDAYVQRVTAQGLPGAEIVKDIQAYAATYTAQYR
jgi:TRAP-type C4-dicarboxylate transport system substrate-binding protein